MLLKLAFASFQDFIVIYSFERTSHVFTGVCSLDLLLFGWIPKLFCCMFIHLFVCLSWVEGVVTLPVKSLGNHYIY